MDNLVAFDTLSYARRLREAGVAGPQAEALRDAVAQGVATKADVEDVKHDTAEIKTRVETIEADVGTLKTDVVEIKARVGALETDVGTLKTDVAEIKTKIGALEVAVAGLDARMAGFRTNFAVMQWGMGFLAIFVLAMAGRMFGVF